MGVVYEGADTHLANRRVTIKIRTRGDARRFEREHSALSRLTHAGIVQICDRGEDYIVLGYAEGGTLAAYLQRRWSRSETLELPVAIEILIQLADALDAIHAAGVVHRDLKPTNIVCDVDDDGVVAAKIVDFGIALLDGAALITRRGQFLGTPAYAAPEQCRGEPVESSADVYALGVIAFEMITGERPYPGEALPEIGHRHRHEHPSWSALNTRCPAELATSVRQMLAPHPASRPTAKVLVTRFRRLRSLGARSARPVQATFVGPTNAPGQIDDGPSSAIGEKRATFQNARPSHFLWTVVVGLVVGAVVVAVISRAYLVAFLRPSALPVPAPPAVAPAGMVEGIAPQRIKQPDIQTANANIAVRTGSKPRGPKAHRPQTSAAASDQRGPNAPSSKPGKTPAASSSCARPTDFSKDALIPLSEDECPKSKDAPTPPASSKVPAPLSPEEEQRAKDFRLANPY
jgi:serine/threonine-protein kinase